MLSKQSGEYADKLRWQNWNQVCNSLQGMLSTRKMWNILRSLISRKESKTVTGQHTEHLIHNFPGTEEDVVKAVNEKFTGPQQSSSVQFANHPNYSGLSNPALDYPFTRAELEAALGKLTRNTTPGRDRINNKTLQHLANGAKDSLLGRINESWESGIIPALWKHADITMIPKPNKAIIIQNLLPISLMSCARKLFKNMVHD